MNSFMSWVGGKKALRDAVLARFPPYYERYIEVFGAQAGCFFANRPVWILRCTTILTETLQTCTAVSEISQIS